MARIGPRNPGGFVYVVSAEGCIGSTTFYTKIGCSSTRFDDPNGRGSIARFWIEALGLGKLRVFELPHANAYFLESKVHEGLKLAEGRGRSTEAFDISFDDAVERVKCLAQEI